MTKDQIVEVIAEYGSQQAKECSSTHPEDIANAMSFAVEHAGGFMELLLEKGYLK